VPTQHNGAFATSYCENDAGDATRDETRAVHRTTTAMFWLKSVEVLTASTRGAVVAFGDSITDGTCSTVDGHDRWVDWMSIRLYLDARNRKAASYKAVVNEGISGNTIAREHIQPPPDSPPAIERLERDVLTHNGITDVIVFIGTNDIRQEATGRGIAGSTMASRIQAKDEGDRGHHHSSPRRSCRDQHRMERCQDGDSQPGERLAEDQGEVSLIDFDQVVHASSNADLIDPPPAATIHPTPRGYGYGHP
jgi:hypothetical protein